MGIGEGSQDSDSTAVAPFFSIAGTCGIEQAVTNIAVKLMVVSLAISLKNVFSSLRTPIG